MLMPFRLTTEVSLTASLIETIGFYSFIDILNLLGRPGVLDLDTFWLLRNFLSYEADPMR
jgi:hypothetical protein